MNIHNPIICNDPGLFGLFDRSRQEFIYAPQIPTGTARTHGHGTTVDVYVVRRSKTGRPFKTFNSPFARRWFIGRCRTDYGMTRGTSAKMFQKAIDLLKMVRTDDLGRTTKEEF